ncbi:hypothetical protein [Thermococcus aggregans]|nr:hypothetical protein [Thermococcus aggregans]
MEWKSLFIGLLIGALIAVPFGMAHGDWFGPMRGKAAGVLAPG